MDYQKFEDIMHPVRIRVLSWLHQKGTATTKELSKVCPDVAPATLYRQVARLHRDGLIAVERENVINGIVEKVYRLEENVFEDLGAERSPQKIMGLFYHFMLSMLSDFQQYLSQEGIDPERDGAGFGYSLLRLDDQEFEAFFKQMQTDLEKWADLPPQEGRRLRRFSTIVVPIVKEGPS